MACGPLHHAIECLRITGPTWQSLAPWSQHRRMGLHFVELSGSAYARCRRCLHSLRARPDSVSRSTSRITNETPWSIIGYSAVALVVVLCALIGLEDVKSDVEIAEAVAAITHLVDGDPLPSESRPLQIEHARVGRHSQGWRRCDNEKSWRSVLLQLPTPGGQRDRGTSRPRRQSPNTAAFG
jgi:hypothetical protein